MIISFGEHSGTYIMLPPGKFGNSLLLRQTVPFIAPQLNWRLMVAGVRKTTKNKQTSIYIYIEDIILKQWGIVIKFG